MARQPTMPKAVSSLQSVQRSYTSEFLAEELFSELVAKKEGIGNSLQSKRKGTWSSAATRVVLAKDARRVVAVDTVTAELS
jgi:hypothetical protein